MFASKDKDLATSIKEIRDVASDLLQVSKDLEWSDTMLYYLEQCCKQLQAIADNLSKLAETKK